MLYKEPFLPRNLKLKPYSRELRTNATQEENELWYKFLRNLKPRFTRQRIVGPYILDFFCYEAKLAIELDGAQHHTLEAIKYDKTRTKYLNSLGIEVVRFNNSSIFNSFDSVCMHIAKNVEERLP